LSFDSLVMSGRAWRVPLDPEFRPIELAAEVARALFSQFAPNADEITFLFKQDVEFFTPEQIGLAWLVPIAMWTSKTGG